VREQVRGAIFDALTEWGGDWGEAFPVSLVERLTQDVMVEVESWVRKRVESRTELIRDVRGVIRDYTEKPELGFLAIKHLIKGRK